MRQDDVPQYLLLANKLSYSPFQSNIIPKTPKTQINPRLTRGHTKGLEMLVY